MGRLLPQEQILFPRSLYGRSVVCCSTGFCAKTYWGLNKTAGIVVLPMRHPARSARLPYALYDDKEPCKCSNPIKRVRRENCVTRDAFSKSLTGFGCYYSHTRQPVNLQGCQLLFWNFFLFGKEKSGTFSLYKGWIKKRSDCFQRILKKPTSLNKISLYFINKSKFQKKGC